MKLYYKTRQAVLQNAAAILLQNTTEVYYKMRHVFYFKKWQLNAKIIKKCDSYYKMQRLFHNETVITKSAARIKLYILTYSS